MDKLDIILTTLETVNDKIDVMDKRIDNIDNRIDAMDKRINNMEQDIKHIQISLENEIRPNIMRVAEGHLDLSRNLKEAIKSNNEFEMLTLKVSILEADLRKVKNKIS